METRMELIREVETEMLISIASGARETQIGFCRAPGALPRLTRLTKRVASFC